MYNKKIAPRKISSGLWEKISGTKKRAYSTTSDDEILEYAESFINAVREPLIVLDRDLRVLSASHSFYTAFKVKPEETLGRRIYDLGNKQWDIPELRHLLETLLPQKTILDDYELKHDFLDLGRRTMLFNAREIPRKAGEERLIGENIDLLWNPGQNLWLVKMDPSQLDQILVNLVVNARDAIADVGKITMETENIEFDQHYCDSHTGFVPGPFVMLTVSDTGCGMEKEIFDNLFEPFFTTKELGKGTGLGLPTVYGIVKQNNGFINVYSEPGLGTAFKIYLPRHAGEAVVLSQENHEQYPSGKGETILVLEDEISVLNLAQTMLQKLGYKVLASNSANEALEVLKSRDGAIDLLITDVIMPEMNGLDFTTQANSLYPDIKALFMSGYTSDVIVRHGILEEGVCYIQKPFSLKNLAVTVRKMIDECK